MARPRKTGDTFSYDDLAVVGGMTKNTFRHVADARLLPADKEDQVRTLKRVAVIGAFMAAGVPLMPAGQIADALSLEYGRADGEARTGLYDLWCKLPVDEIEALPARNAYWLHQVLLQHPGIYRPGEALARDVIFEIADRALVFTRLLPPNLTAIDPFAPEAVSSGISPVGRIEGWHRGGAFIHFIEAVVPFGEDGEPTPAAKELYKQMIAARRNAIGLITVNLSLAIRNGLDRLAERRAKLEINHDD